MNKFTTPFDQNSTADDVLDGVDLSGRRAIVTGGASGIGVETVRTLAAHGAAVTLAVRNLAAGHRIAGEISAKTEGADLTVARLDLADQSSVDEFVANWAGPLHILVNNAGIMAVPDRQLSPEGWELQFATNHLGHFHLALGLHDALAAAGNARLVVVSSSAHRRSPVVFDDINFERREYEPWLAYGQSKTANVLFAVEAAKRWASDGIIANALMPGGIRTNLQRYVEAELNARFASYPWKTVEQGAATSALLAGSPLLDGVTGRYFENCNEPELTTDPDGYAPGVHPHALDPEAASRLWDVSMDLVGK